jgi:hypothetical protein
LSWSNDLCVSILANKDSRRKQGDQIGPIFAFWVLVYKGQVFFKLQSSQIFRTTFSMVKVVHYIIFTKTVLGRILAILGDFGRFWAIFSIFHPVALAADDEADFLP